MKQKLDLEHWPRKQHFEFFRQFEEPYFGVTVTVDCTLAYEHAKAHGVSLFIYYLYQSLTAANEIEPFRYRIEGDDLFMYDTVNAAPTINRPDGTFGFGYFDYSPSFETFLNGAEKEIERIQSSTDLMPATSGQNIVQYSALPWLNFSSLSHARMFRYLDSAPKISFGQITEQDGLKMMPVSIHVHHALMDGLHVGQYVQRFQDLLNMGV